MLEIAARGAALGCKEALFTLGDRPEDRWKQAREWLDAHGYDDTLSYVRAMAIRVLEETGLLPHLNPGVLTWQDFQRLKPVAPSMGMMLETTAKRLFTERGGPHFGSPDKDPAVRLRVLEDAGRSNVPFTTGILIGIGETLAERADSMFAIRQVAREYGGIQEVIVQNFRAKPDTAMRGAPDADLDDLAATIAVARLVLGPKVRMQAPPNLVGEEYRLMLARRDRRLGRGVAGDPGPREPGAALAADRRSGRAHRRGGLHAARAADVYPGYLREPWLDPRFGRACRGAGRPGDRAGRARARCPSGCRGRSRTAAGAGRGPHRPARGDRHGGPERDRRVRFRRGLRRLGRVARGSAAGGPAGGRGPGRRQPARARRGFARCCRAAAAPSATRPG